MFPHNLLRAETQRRARLIETQTYAVEVDLSGRGVTEPDNEFLSTTTVLRAPGSRARPIWI